MTKRALLICVVMFLIGAAAGAEASDLFGTVKLNGKPVPNAELTLKRGDLTQTAKTNERGYYSIRKLEPGNYALTVVLPQNGKREVQVYVFPQSTEKNIDLK